MVATVASQEKRSSEKVGCDQEKCGGSCEGEREVGLGLDTLGLIGLGSRLGSGLGLGLFRIT